MWRLKVIFLGYFVYLYRIIKNTTIEIIFKMWDLLVVLLRVLFEMLGLFLSPLIAVYGVIKLYKKHKKLNKIKKDLTNEK